MSYNNAANGDYAAKYRAGIDRSLERWAERHDPDRLVRVGNLVSLDDAARRIGLTRGSVVNHYKTDETFPCPVWLSGGQAHPVFDLAEIRDWYESPNRSPRIHNIYMRAQHHLDRSSSGEQPPPPHHAQ